MSLLPADRHRRWWPAGEHSAASDGGDKRGKKAGKAGGKDAAPPGSPAAALLGHYTEAGFARRLAAFQAWRAEDEEELRAKQAAVTAAAEREASRRAEEVARLAAEAATFKAKRRAMRAAAAGGSPGGSPEPPAVPAPSGPPPQPQHGGLAGLCVEQGAAFLSLPNPAGPHTALAACVPGLAAAAAGAPSPPSTALPGSVAAAVGAAAEAAAAVWELPRLPHAERLVAEALGAPHNFNGFPPGEQPLEPAPEQPPQQADAAGAAEQEVPAAEPSHAHISLAGHAELPAALADAATAAAAGAEACYGQQLRSGRAAALRRALGVVGQEVAAALAEVALQHGAAVADPTKASPHAARDALLAVARALLAAADAGEGAFVDPYTSPVYEVQLSKIAAKAEREAARAAAAAAKADRCGARAARLQWLCAYTCARLSCEGSLSFLGRPSSPLLVTGKTWHARRRRPRLRWLDCRLGPLKCAGAQLVTVSVGAAPMAPVPRAWSAPRCGHTSH